MSKTTRASAGLLAFVLAVAFVRYAGPDAEAAVVVGATIGCVVYVVLRW